jgi:hypothetical protein
MKLYLDTEFNGFNGALMSMALVPENTDTPEFYVELEMREQLHPWVSEHVVPHMVLLPVSHNVFQQRLVKYLRDINEEIIIVADWPDDIRHFCDSLITGPGESLFLGKNLKFELDFNINYVSLVPHNALHDARGIRDFYKTKL